MGSEKSASILEQVRLIFTEALQFQPGDDRESYLEKACGEDKEIRREVDDLLRASKKSGAFLVDDIFGQHSSDPETLIGSVIDQYEVVELLGQGGFGDIYRVEQKTPIHRELALKILKPGMNNIGILNRFAQEEEALSMMYHPNISSIMDAGTTSDQRPYFVMDLVLGTPITVYCDRHAFSLKKRLKLFRVVCSAVQHAHQKGVIHRDLKPENIVIVDEGGEPLVKIIDFGIAKIVKDGFNAHGKDTQSGYFIGTPDYMSPEQISRSSEYLDTRTDIYSLGIVLYELISGLKPYDCHSLEHLELAEILRIISDVVPEQPSERLRKNRGLSIELADKRSVDPKILVRDIKGDLDWIVMKAIQKDRNNRYQEVAELSTEIHKHLEQKHVEPETPGIFDRLKQLVLRN